MHERRLPWRQPAGHSCRDTGVDGWLRRCGGVWRVPWDPSDSRAHDFDRLQPVVLSWQRSHHPRLRPPAHQRCRPELAHQRHHQLGRVTVARRSVGGAFERARRRPLTAAARSLLDRSSPSKHVTAVADLGLGLMIASVHVTGRRARCAIHACRAVRRMARGADGVRSDRVQRRELRGLVAGCACRRCRNSSRPVGSMARGTAPRDLLVFPALLLRMTRSAGRGRSTLARVRFMAIDTGLVARRCRGLLRSVTAPARRRRSLPVHVVAMTSDTAVVARIRVGELDLAGVARLADRRLRGWREVMRAMARHAGRPGVGSRVRRRDRLVARRAIRSYRAAVRRWMRRVAGDTRALRPVLDLDVRVAAFA